MSLAGYILLVLLCVSYTGIVVADEESLAEESSPSRTSNANTPTGTTEKQVEESEVEGSEGKLDTFVPSEQVSPDSSISFPVDI